MSIICKTFYSLLTTKTFYFSKTTAVTYLHTHSQRSKPACHPHSCTYTEHTLARISHSATQQPNAWGWGSCYPDVGRGPNSYAPQPTFFPNHHTVVGDTPHRTHYTLANSHLHQPLISLLYMIPSCKQYWKDVQTWCKVWNHIDTEFDY